MTKVSVTAPKTQMESVVNSLHDLGLMDFDQYDGELETGSPMEGSEEISQLLVDIRAVLSKINVESAEEASVEEVRENISNINKKVKDAESKISSLEAEKENLIQKKKIFTKLSGANVDLRELEETKSLDYRILKFDEQKFKEIYGSRNYEIFHGKEASVLAYMSKEEKNVEESLQGLIKKEYDVPVESGTPDQIISSVDSQISEIEEQIRSTENVIEDIETNWGQKLNYVENFLSQKIEKAEAPLSFATTKKSFIVEGWIPSEKEGQFKKSVTASTDNKVHIEIEEDGENPPVKYDNNSVVQPFESLTDLMSRPKYGELDPSFLILLTFPLFFGFMIGDAGYGMSMFAVWYIAMKMFPKGAAMFKALMWTAGATFIFGLLYGEMFGFQIYESPFYRADWWTEIFYLTIGIGVAHVNLGLLVGAYNEYLHHGVMEAIFAKISWIFLQIAALAAYLTATAYGTTPGYLVGLGIGIPILIMMYKGEGIEALVEIPSLVSNILSYLRLFGVCMAAYTLAGTVNAIAGPALASGTAAGLIGGTLILIVGHIILTFIKIMEGFLQGIRLHYVEQFGWFYEGGGRKYSPFGGSN